MGMIGVSNQIRVTPQPSGLIIISDDIRHAVHQSWMFDEKMTLAAARGAAFLTGNVDKWLPPDAKRARPA